jgi:hypothetical protein
VSLRFLPGAISTRLSVDKTKILCRDPWWVFTCLSLFHAIRKCYGASVLGLVRRSPRLGILLGAIFLAMVFTLMDILAVSIPALTGGVDGYSSTSPSWMATADLKCVVVSTPTGS